MATNWREWKAVWSNYSFATKLDEVDEVRQVVTLSAVMGKGENKVYRTFVWCKAQLRKSSHLWDTS